MATEIDKEIEAMRAVLNALSPLSPEVRMHVLDYVSRRLGLQLHANADDQVEERTTDVGSIDARTGLDAEQADNGEPSDSQSPESVRHIKELRQEKKPQSNVEMAAIVAYYLAYEAEQNHRKESITSKDLATYFRIADFPLPGRTRDTLLSARKAGYFDSGGKGSYKLNAVGYNLVAHNLPREGSETSPGPVSRRRRPKRATKKAKKPKKARKAKKPRVRKG